MAFLWPLPHHRQTTILPAHRADPAARPASAAGRLFTPPRVADSVSVKIPEATTANNMNKTKRRPRTKPQPPLTKKAWQVELKISSSRAELSDQPATGAKLWNLTALMDLLRTVVAVFKLWL